MEAVMNLPAHLCSVFVGVIVACIFLSGSGRLLDGSPRVLSSHELAGLKGGECPHHHCKDETCSCELPDTCSLVTGSDTDCHQQSTNDFAKCAVDATAKAETKCTHVSGGNCGTKKVGTKSIEGCSCSGSINCGQVSYTCTASSCEG